MGRRVSVTVEADFSDVVDGAAETAVAAKVAKKELEALGREADRTGRDMDELAAETALAKKELQSLDRTVVIIPGHARNMEKSADGAAKGVSKVGEEAKQTEADLKLLDRRIATLQRSLRNLNINFAAGSRDSGIVKRIADQDKLLKQLEELRKKVAGGPDKDRVSLDSLLPNASTVAAAGMTAGNGFAAAFSGAFKEVPLKGVLIAALVGIVAGALPTIGGMLAGAVVGGVGTLGLAGGIFAASKDSSVRSALSQLGALVSGEFFKDGSSFVDPIRESIGILKKDFLSLDLKSLFANAAPDLTIIISGLGDMVKNLMPGLNHALAQSEPYARAAAHGFAEIGDALSNFFEDAVASHGALEGLQLLFRFVADTILFLGNTLQWLSDRLHQINVIIEWTVQHFAELADVMGLPSESLHNFADRLHDFNNFGALYISDTAPKMGAATEDLAEKAAGAAGKWVEYQMALKGVHDEMLALSDANIAVAQDFADLHKELHNGKGAWDVHTQAGRDNLTMINRTIGDLDRQRVAALENSDGTVEATDAINKKYNEQIAQLVNVAKQAGATKDVIDSLVKNYHFTLSADIVLRYTKVVQNKTDKDLALHGYASGGDPDPGLAWVGEHGKELVDFGSGAHVFNHQQSMSMSRPWGGSASGGGGGTMRHVLELQLNGRTIRTLLLTDGTSRGVSKVDLAEAYP